MTSFAPRTIVALALLAGAAAGCAHRRGTGETEVVKPPRESTAENSSTVTSEELERTPNESIEQALSGRVSGVRVTPAPGGGINVRIRGSTSINATNEPLYILDGIPIEAPGGTLTGINMRDIASIEVLKDAAETAMYGVRGANGVIVIKTKKPGPNQ